MNSAAIFIYNRLVMMLTGSSWSFPELVQTGPGTSKWTFGIISIAGLFRPDALPVTCSINNQQYLSTEGELTPTSKNHPHALLHQQTPNFPRNGTLLRISINRSKFIFWATTKYYNVLHASAQKAAIEALLSLKWPPKQTTEHKYAFMDVCVDSFSCS